MKKIFKFSVYIFVFCLFFQSKMISDEFTFEGKEIQILNEGNKLVSKEGVKIITDDNINIISDEFEYDKEKSEHKYEY